jgi:F-type H+-transporting ATPase subunit delta
MNSRALAFQYAKGLFSVAIDGTDPARVDEELKAFADFMDRQVDLARLVENPALPATAKEQVVRELLELSPVTPLLAEFLKLLARQDRLVLLPGIAEEYQARLMRHLRIEMAEIITAVPLPDAVQAEIARGLSVATGKQIRVTARVDPSIIGGVRARVGSTVYDGSVRRQLERIGEQLAEGA